jgi:D-alanyl-lipoteichoic acid acyltransferase DltB (MBOAT superfamily)
MEITSINFIILAIVSVIGFYLLENKYRTGFLALASLFFIGSFSYVLVLYILIYSFINYIIGINIPVSRFRIALFRTGIIINISQIVLLRYASFAIDPFLQIFNENLQVSVLSVIIIPVGISYFTLQGIGYLINVKMAWEKPEKNFLDFLLYIAFFPKFLSGPVERSNHFLPQLKKPHLFNEGQLTEGLKIILLGFFKKLAIANPLAPFIMSAYSNLNSTDGYSFWILFLLQPIYLYFDFSGYTDIAIGLAKTFGIELLPNFNRPFLAENVTTFWKRFHISLSSWFNDYIFRQTSFRYRRWGINASVYAVFLTWILFGIWHGAGWNFMILGIIQALAINFEFFTKGIRLRLFSKIPDNLRVWSGRLLTYLFYCTALVFFFSPDINSAIAYFSRLIKFVEHPLSLLGSPSLFPFAALTYGAFLLLLELLQNDYSKDYNKLETFWRSEKKANVLFRWTVYSSVITIIFIASNEVHQFVYVNF